MHYANQLQRDPNVTRSKNAQPVLPFLRHAINIGVQRTQEKGKNRRVPGYLVW